MTDSARNRLPALRRSPLFSRLQDAASRLPGAQLAADTLREFEQVALAELKARLDTLERQQVPDDSAFSLTKRMHPRTLLTALLEESAEQKQDDARRSLYTSMLLELTPDEACLLATLSDGTEHALVHVNTGGAIGPGMRIASNFSALGKSSSVKLRDCTPAYLDHLLSLGLAETGPENKELEIKYQIIEGDPQVRGIAEKLKEQGRAIKFQRRVVRMSGLGYQLWEYCKPA